MDPHHFFQWSQFMCTLSMEELSALPDCEQEGRPPCVATPTATGSCPKSLVEFISRCGRCSLDRGVDDVVAANALPLRRDIARGMNPKKEHEVGRLCPTVLPNALILLVCTNIPFCLDNNVMYQ